jgi:hypothetical protein
VLHLLQCSKSNLLYSYTIEKDEVNLAKPRERDNCRTGNASLYIHCYNLEALNLEVKVIRAIYKGFSWAASSTCICSESS